MDTRERLIETLDCYLRLQKLAIGLGVEDCSVVEDYWRPEDRKLLEDLPTEILLAMAFRLYKELREDPPLRGTSILSDVAFPFCHYFMCEICPYGKKKGICDEEGSTVWRIQKAMNRVPLIGEKVNGSRIFEISGLKDLVEDIIRTWAKDSLEEFSPDLRSLIKEVLT